jgi:hypothetical protein
MERFGAMANRLARPVPSTAWGAMVERRRSAPSISAAALLRFVQPVAGRTATRSEYSDLPRRSGKAGFPALAVTMAGVAFLVHAALDRHNSNPARPPLNLLEVVVRLAGSELPDREHETQAAELSSPAIAAPCASACPVLPPSELVRLVGCGARGMVRQRRETGLGRPTASRRPGSLQTVRRSVD